MVERLNVVNNSQNQSSVLIWRGLFRIWNQRFPQQPFAYGETFQLCPWQPKHMIIGADLKKSASNVKPTVSAATVFLWWNVSRLSMTTEAWDHLWWFEEVCYESETTGFCSNHLLIVKHLSVRYDTESLGSSVQIWRGVPRIWSQRFLQQPFS